MPWLLVVGGQLQGSRLCVRGEGTAWAASLIACGPATDRRPPATKALHAICGNTCNTSIVSSSWWWAYKCPKHVEQITSVINVSVASSWFSSLRIYSDARTDIHQISTLVSWRGKIRYGVSFVQRNYKKEQNWRHFWYCWEIRVYGCSSPTVSNCALPQLWIVSTLPEGTTAK